MLLHLLTIIFLALYSDRSHASTMAGRAAFVWVIRRLVANLRKGDREWKIPRRAFCTDFRARIGTIGCVCGNLASSDIPEVMQHPLKNIHNIAR